MMMMMMTKLVFLATALLCLSKAGLALNSRDTSILQRLVDHTNHHQFVITSTLLNRLPSYQIDDQLVSESYLANVTVDQIYSTFEGKIHSLYRDADDQQSKLELDNHIIAPCLNDFRKKFVDTLHQARFTADELQRKSYEVIVAYEEFLMSKIVTKVEGETPEVSNYVRDCFAEHKFNEDAVVHCIEETAGPAGEDTMNRALDVWVYVSVSQRSGHLQLDTLHGLLIQFSEHNDETYDQLKYSMQQCAMPR